MTINLDLSEDPARSDKEKIENEGLWVPCRFCLVIFRRIRFTKRYCRDCEKGACEGEHLTFYDRRGAVCVKCNMDV